PRPAAPPPQPVELPAPEPQEPQLIVVGTTEQEPERDLAAELKAAVGVPTDCVSDFAASSPTTIRINISAIVRLTGMVIEPSAYGSGLSEAARNCIEDRIGRVMLKPLDDAVSKSVSTVIEINYEPPVIVEVDPSVPTPHLEDVVHPLPKKESLPRGQGTPIEKMPYRPISGGAETEPIEAPHGQRRIKGPKPRAIDGYEVDENAQDWN
ncbi:MAG: hypothetical protein WCE62_18600, partial [Polyangiales bacterium]